MRRKSSPMTRCRARSCTDGTVGVVKTTCAKTAAGPNAVQGPVQTCVNDSSTNAPFYYETTCTYPPATNKTEFPTPTLCGTPGITTPTAAPWITTRLPQAGGSEQRHRLCRSAFLHRRCRNGAALPEGRLHEGRDAARQSRCRRCRARSEPRTAALPTTSSTSAPSGAIRRPPWWPRARRRIPPFRPTSSRPAARTAPTRRCCPAPSATPTWTASTR